MNSLLSVWGGRSGVLAGREVSPDKVNWSWATGSQPAGAFKSRGHFVAVLCAGTTQSGERIVLLGQNLVFPTD